MTEQRSWIDGPVKASMWVSCLFTVLMMVHIAVDVVLRVGFNAPMIGTFEVVSNYYMVAVMYLPLAYVSYTEGQIIVELFTRGFGQKTLLRWDGLANFVTVLYLLAFTIYTGIMAVEQTETGEVIEVGDEFMILWPARWILPIAFGLIALYLIVRIGQDNRQARDMKVPISA